MAEKAALFSEIAREQMAMLSSIFDEAAGVTRATRTSPNLVEVRVCDVADKNETFEAFMKPPQGQALYRMIWTNAGVDPENSDGLQLAHVVERGRTPADAVNSLFLTIMKDLRAGTIVMTPVAIDEAAPVMLSRGQYPEKITVLKLGLTS